MAVSTPAHATAATTIVTVDDTGGALGFAADYVVDSGQLTAQDMSASSVVFTGGAAGSNDSTRAVEVDVSTPTPLAVQTYNLPSDATLLINVDGNNCHPTAGTLQVLEQTFTGDVFTTFAADYTNVTCAEAPTSRPMSGVIRWNADSTYEAVQVSPRTWDFGDQLLKIDSQPVTITFQNIGTNSVTYGPAALTGATGAFVIKTDLCSGNAVDPGAPCTVTVAANPKVAVSDTFAGSFATLTLPSQTIGLADRVVKLAVEGNNLITNYALPGPHQVRLHWRQLPAPIGAAVDHYQINRGTAPHALTKFRDVSMVCCPIDQTDGSVTPGKVYYYAIQPMFVDGASGVATPVIASEPWPKYGPGMYHRVGPMRIVSGHVISAGDPFTLQVLGHYGVPRSGVAAVALNVLGSNATSATNITVYPTGSRQPAAADLALNRGATATNFVLVKVGTGGRITISTRHGNTKVFVDLSGFVSGNGLAASYGQGGALQEYTKGGVIMDTKAFHIGALKHDYYVDSPVNFNTFTTPHVTSLLVNVTAYGSAAPGTITAFRTNSRASNAAVLAYGAGGTWSNTALVASGLWPDPSTGTQYPSVSFLNRGPKPVQLKVTILGYVDDNYFDSGQRYYSTAPTRLLASTLGASVSRTVSPGRYGHSLTTAFNVKVSASPTQNTSVSMWPLGVGVGGVAQPQLRTHGRTISSTLEATGHNNQFAVKNASGRDALTIWSFGRFDAWPIPSWTWYVHGAASTNAASNGAAADAMTAGPAESAMNPA
ncbi:MAG TPA: hypothetical protein VKB75_16490, partial [Jatrophihabitans sp.]|nr:hypothetical protein [Jatrophihabitans sp.]